MLLAPAGSSIPFAFARLKTVFPLAFFLIAVLLPLGAWAQSQDFTIVALPDTQYYSASYPNILNSQMQWIVNNQAALNIQLVIGEGDIVNGGGSLTQWANADNAYKMLDAAHIPYIGTIGNHDYDANNPPARTPATTNFNHYFGPARYQNPAYWPMPYWRGSYPAGSNENFYSIVNVAGQNYLIVALEFYPRDAALSWAANVIQNNSDKPVIIVTHSYGYLDNTRVSACNSFDAQYYGMASDNDGDAMWAKLVRQYPNIFMVLSGHIVGGSGAPAAGHRSDLGDNGNLVNQIMANYQNMTNGGQGYLRIMTFHPASDTISVTTYSPYLSGYLTDAANQFTVFWHHWTGTGNGSISGWVKDISTCSALAGATISTPAKSATTGSAGGYALSSLAPGTYSLTASASGYTPISRSVDVGPGMTANAKMPLGKASGQINGTVTNSGGSAISGATVHLVGSSSSGVDEVITTDTSGAFASGSIPAATYQATASATGYSASSANVSLASGATVTQNFALSPTTQTLSVTAISPNNGPLTGGTSVTVTGAGFQTGATLAIGGVSATVSSVTANSISAVTPAGTAGPADVLVTNPDGTTATLSGGFTYTTSTGGGGGTSTISGAVTKTDTTTGIGGATVTYSGGSATTSSAGSYTLSNVPAGSTITLTAAASGYQSAGKSVTPASGATTTLNFSLLPNCTLSSTTPSVTICLPTANSTVLNPVQIIAKTRDTHTVSYTQIYIDGTKKYQVSGGSVNTALTLTTGVSHRLTVQATDSAGVIFKQTIYVTAH